MSCHPTESVQRRQQMRAAAAAAAPSRRRLSHNGVGDGRRQQVARIACNRYESLDAGKSPSQTNRRECSWRLTESAPNRRRRRHLRLPRPWSAIVGDVTWLWRHTCVAHARAPWRVIRGPRIVYTLAAYLFMYTRITEHVEGRLNVKNLYSRIKSDSEEDNRPVHSQKNNNSVHVVNTLVFHRYQNNTANFMLKGRIKVKVAFLYSASYTANHNSALYNLGSGSWLARASGDAVVLEMRPLIGCLMLRSIEVVISWSRVYERWNSVPLTSWTRELVITIGELELGSCTSSSRWAWLRGMTSYNSR